MLLLMFVVGELPLTTSATAAVDAIRIEAEAEARSPRAVAISPRRLARAQRAAEALPDLVDEVAGARVQDLGGPEAVRRVGIRGGTAAQTLVVLDGVPIRLPFATGVDLELFPVAALSRIEVVRGGAGARLGRGALTGAVKLTTARGDGRPHVAVTAGAGSFGTYRVSAAGSARGVSAAASFRSTEGRFSFDDAAPGLPSELRRRENADVRRWGLTVAASTQAWGWSLGARTVVAGREAGTPGFSSQPNLQARELRNLAFASVEARRRVGAWAWTGRLHAAHQDLDARDPAPGTETERGVDFQAVGGTAEVEGVLGLHAIRLAAHVEAARAAGSLAEGRRTVGFRMEDEWFLTDHLSLNGTVGVEALSDQGQYLLPHVSLHWDQPQWRLSVGVGRSLRAPTLDELYRPPEPGLVGNPDLRAETAWEGDLRFTWQDRSLRLDASAFARNIEQPILYLNRNAFVVRPENLDETTAWGVELSAGKTARLGPLQLDLEVNGTWLEARLAATGDRLPGQPQWTGFAAAWLAFATVEFGTRVRAVGPTQTRLRAAPDNEIPTYVRWDASWRTELPARTWLVVRFDNLLDDRSLRSLNKLPLPGRSVFALVGWRTE